MLTDDAYGNPLNFDPANALTTLLYSGEIFDQRIAMQYLRARYYDPATGTFNRLDPFAGRSGDPQSLHKYLYVHGDPIQGIDPTGLWTMKSTLGAMAIGTALTAYNGYVFWKAERSVGYGLAQGAFGSAALINAYAVKDKSVFLEAVMTSALAGSIYAVYEYATTGAMPSHWKIQSYTLEGLNWGAFYSMYLAPSRWHGPSPPNVGGPIDVFDYFGSSYALGFMQLLSMGIGASMDFYAAISIVLTTRPNNPDREIAANIVRNTLHECVDVFLGAALNLTIAGPIDYKISEAVPGLRALPPGLKKELMDKIVTLATGGSISGIAAAIVDDLGDAIADSIIGK